jgi:hypothetical protein
MSFALSPTPDNRQPKSLTCAKDSFREKDSFSRRSSRQDGSDLARHLPSAQGNFSGIQWVSGVLSLRSHVFALLLPSPLLYFATPHLLSISHSLSRSLSLLKSLPQLRTRSRDLDRPSDLDRRRSLLTSPPCPSCPCPSCPCPCSPRVGRARLQRLGFAQLAAVAHVGVHG